MSWTPDPRHSTAGLRVATSLSRLASRLPLVPGRDIHTPWTHAAGSTIRGTQPPRVVAHSEPLHGRLRDDPDPGGGVQRSSARLGLRGSFSGSVRQ